MRSRQQESAMQPNAMQPREFAAYHLPALERDEARHNLIVAVLGRLAGEDPPELLWWSLGEPGQCAIEAPGYPIVLGDVNAAQCHALAEGTRLLDYPAVVGADETPHWFVDGEPVSTAGIMRRTRLAGAIAGVYTPPKLRGRGYAGSVTAAVVDAIFAEGRSMACLYVDLRNPFSSRCYAKIGFTPVCRSC